MANRPRRPRTGGRPETIIDGEAERIEATGGTDDSFGADEADRATTVEPGVASAAAEPDEAVVSGGAATSDALPAKSTDVTTGAADADEAQRVHEAVTGPVAETGDSVDPAHGSALPAGDDRRIEAEAFADQTPPAQTPAGEFGREDGAADGATLAEPTRRHLGEFEDDETVHPEAEAARTQTSVPDNSPYLAGHSTAPSGGRASALCSAPVRSAP